MSSSYLPAFVSFSIIVGNDLKYLRHIGTSLSYEDEAGAVDPNTRFAVERAESGGGLVHLRHCFTNRYLARGVDEASSYIKAEAEEIVEDESVEGCTLFRPQIENENTISLVHIQSGLGVCVKHITSPIKRSYWVLAGEPGGVPLATQYFDLESLVILPKRVVFKGDNGKYLGYTDPDYNKILRSNIDDAADPKAQFEVVQHKRGYTTIKSPSLNRFWHILQTDFRNVKIVISKGIVVFSAEDNETPSAWLTPINGPNDSICLRGVHGSFANKFLERVSRTSPPIFKDSLTCNAQSLIPTTLLKMEEPIVSRMVWMDFRLDNGRIFNQRPLFSVSGTYRNESDYDQGAEMDVSYKKTTTKTWNNTIRAMVGQKMSFKAKFPFVAETKLETTVELEYQREWGGSVSTEESVSNKAIVKVPAWQMATAYVVATEGQCNVPFSYRQRDQLLSGQVVETILHDGVYDNVNNYSFHTVIRVVPIDSPKDQGVPKRDDSTLPITSDEYESLIGIYKSKVAEARATGKLDELESTPTIIYGSLGKEKLKNEEPSKTE